VFGSSFREGVEFLVEMVEPPLSLENNLFDMVDSENYVQRSCLFSRGLKPHEIQPLLA